MATSAGFAETRHHARVSAQSQDQYRYQAAVPATLPGTYKSNDFFPSPLVLNITGADRSGNLSGSIWGMRSSYIGGETGDRWENWQNVFGRDGTRAFYKDGAVNIVFKNGASYVLGDSGNQLSGKFAAGNQALPLTAPS